MKITELAVHSLSMKDVERLISLARYHHSAVLLGIEKEDYLKSMATQRIKKKRQEVLHTFTRPFVELWIAYVYVVHEGFIKVPINDDKLDQIASLGDLKMLEVFRHNTFHYNPRHKSKQHLDLYQSDKLRWVRDLHEYHGVLVHRFLDYIKTHPNLDKNVLL